MLNAVCVKHLAGGNCIKQHVSRVRMVSAGSQFYFSEKVLEGKFNINYKNNYYETNGITNW